MKEAIRRRALELGFDDCRFASADSPPGAKQFQDWLGEKRHGEMAWLERTAPKRIDPQKVLPGAKSIICLAVNYKTRVERRESRARHETQRDFQPSTFDSRRRRALGLY